MEIPYNESKEHLLNVGTQVRLNEDYDNKIGVIINTNTASLDVAIFYSTNIERVSYSDIVAIIQP